MSCVRNTNKLNIHCLKYHHLAKGNLLLTNRLAEANQKSIATVDEFNQNKRARAFKNLQLEENLKHSKKQFPEDLNKIEVEKTS